MPAGDLSASYVIDDVDVGRSLARIERLAEQHARKTAAALSGAPKDASKAWVTSERLQRAAMVGLAASVRVGQKALEEFAKVSETGAQALESIHEASHNLSVNVGRDLTSLLSPAASFIGMLDSARTKVVNFLVDAPKFLSAGDFGNGENAADKDAAARADEAMQRQVKQQQAFWDLRKKNDAEIAAAAGDEYAAAMIRAEMAFKQTQRDLAGKVKSGEITKGQSDELTNRAIDLRQRTEDKITQTRDDAAQKDRDDQAKANAARDKEAAAEAKRIADESRALSERHDQEQESLDIKLKEYEIDQLRAQGHEREADLAAIRLKTEKDLLDVYNAQALTDEQRSRYLKEIQAYGDSALAAREGKPQDATKDFRSSSIAAGTLGSTVLAGLVFSGGADTKAVQQKQLSELQTIARATSKMAEAGPAVATFAR